MMRWLTLALTAAVLGACTSGGTSPAERLGPLLEDLVFGEDEVEEGPPVTRTLLNQIPLATISVQTDELPPGYAVAVSDLTDGYVVYQDQARRTVTLLGGLVSGTHGLGFNVDAVKTQVDDPIAVRTPLTDWPDQVVRNYQFALRGAKDYQITVRCQYTPVAQERIEIVQINYTLTRVEETCGNSVRQFTNVYWVDENDGFIWQSKQWIGPRQDPFLLKIIRPFGRS